MAIMPTLAAIGFVGLWAHVLATHLVLVSAASGPSMFPTLAVRDTSLVVSLTHRRGRGVRVGDVVVYRHPGSLLPGHNSHQDDPTSTTKSSSTAVCKRVVALGGDYVVHGLPPSLTTLEPVTAQVQRTARPASDVPMIQVPPGHAWVLGDNLSGSRDSRVYGPVPLALVMGKVVAKIEWKGFVPLISRVENGLQ